MTGNVVNFAKKRIRKATEADFAGLIDADIKANPANVQPLTKSLVDRFEAIKARIESARAEERLEC